MSQAIPVAFYLVAFAEAFQPLPPMDRRQIRSHPHTSLDQRARPRNFGRTNAYPRCGARPLPIGRKNIETLPAASQAEIEAEAENRSSDADVVIAGSSADQMKTGELTVVLQS